MPFGHKKTGSHECDYLLIFIYTFELDVVLIVLI